MTPLAHDDVGRGPLVVLLPGAGDVRSEYRFLVEPLVAAGRRVVAADLPGHGDSPPVAEYTVASTSVAITDLLRALDAGPAVVVAASFAPAAAVWAASERPDMFDGIVLISPHLHDDDSLRGRLQRLAIRSLLRGSWAPGLWASLYSGWYKADPPEDLEAEIAKLRTMLSDADRRRAVRETLTAARDGVAERLASLTNLPTLTVFGSADDHFPNPAAEAAAVAAALSGESLVVDGAGHYPHVERPIQVLAALTAFLARV